MNRVFDALGVAQYDCLVCPGAISLAIDAKHYLVNNGTTMLLDDGVGSRNGTIVKAFSCLDDVAEAGAYKYTRSEAVRHLAKILFRTITGNRFRLNICSIALFNPSEKDRVAFSKLDVIDLSSINDAANHAVASVFPIPSIGADNITTHVIYLGLPDNASAEMLVFEAEIVNLLYERFGNIFIYRAHPRRSNFVDFPARLHFDSRDSLWEAAWASGHFNNNILLTGIGSSAMSSPKFLFGYEPYVMYLHKVLSADANKVLPDEISMNNLRASYSAKGRVLAPRSREEIVSFAASIVSDFSKQDASKEQVNY